jgi:hypothetical protein
VPACVCACVRNAFIKYALQVKGQYKYVKWTKWGQFWSVVVSCGQLGLVVVSRGQWDQVGSRGTKRGQEGLIGQYGERFCIWVGKRLGDALGER